jgi:hypothetical protein
VKAGWGGSGFLSHSKRQSTKKAVKKTQPF